MRVSRRCTAQPPRHSAAAPHAGSMRKGPIMNSIGDVAGSVIIGVGGVINMMLAAVGSGGLAGSLSENVYLPLLGSVAPDFTF